MFTIDFRATARREECPLKFGIGQPVRRVEDQRFLTGHGQYVDDVTLPRQACGAVVMSSHAHAMIRRIDVARAAAADGVLCVLTGADAIADKLSGIPPLFMPEDRGGPKGYRTFRPLLAADRVRHVGERIAFVVAETADQARDAAELIEVEYDPLPIVVRVEDAVAETAPRLWPDSPTGNVCVGLAFGNKEATDAAFARAAHVVSLRLESNRLAANALEPRAALGNYEAADGTYLLYASSQNPHGIRTVAANVFNEPETRFRVIAPDVGGGFGLKSSPHPEDILVLWASRRCGRPVKWVATRNESLIGDNHARDQVVYGELALDSDAKILAVRARALQAVGAYVYAAAVAPLIFSMRFIPNVYAVPTAHVTTQGIFTNTAPLTVYRGAGRPEAAYLIERLMDRAAVELGRDPVEIRRRNMIPPANLPYRTPTGYDYDSGEFERIMERALKLADWAGFAARRSQSEERGRRRGRSVAYYIEQGGNFNDRMELRFDPGGTVTILAGTHSHGQGHATTYAQMVSEWLGVPFETVRFVQGDTDAVTFGRGTFAARSSMIGGCALREAADKIIARAKPMAAALMEASPADVEYSDGRFGIAGTDRSLAMTDVAKAFFHPTGITNKFGLGLEAGGSYAAEPPNHPNGCHVCELEVDPDTGAVAIDRYTVVDDVGRVINPLICDGQVHGGLAQGIGQALLEHALYEPDSGQLLSGSFMDYAMPRAGDLPSFATAFEEIACTTNPLGIKGIGEAGAIGSLPAVINALLDALRPLGVEHLDMPATPARIWSAIRSARRPD
jgi:aerobic carbon-monoxide dehydrogenase large subunit